MTVDGGCRPRDKNSASFLFLSASLNLASNSSRKVILL
nr:MAG TPA: hypothetical protein [Caudoviricetes sp.]